MDAMRPRARPRSEWYVWIHMGVCSQSLRDMPAKQTKLLWQLHDKDVLQAQLKMLVVPHRGLTVHIEAQRTPETNIRSTHISSDNLTTPGT
jgi:hypothetical protein